MEVTAGEAIYHKNDSIMKPYYAEYFKKTHPQLFKEAERAKENALFNELSGLLAETCEKNLGINPYHDKGMDKLIQAIKGS